MHRGRPPKRRICNNLRPPQQRQQEYELPQPLQEITNVIDELSENNTNIVIHENQASTSRPVRSAENDCMNTCLLYTSRCV